MGFSSAIFMNRMAEVTPLRSCCNLKEHTLLPHEALRWLGWTARDNHVAQNISNGHPTTMIACEE